MYRRRRLHHRGTVGRLRPDDDRDRADDHHDVYD
jgi:hypothetical protein